MLGSTIVNVSSFLFKTAILCEFVFMNSSFSSAIISGIRWIIDGLEGLIQEQEFHQRFVFSV